MINFEPTKWDVPFCKECELTLYIKSCAKANHTKIEKPNVPFLAPDMRIFKVRKWATLYSERRNKMFKMSGSKLERVIIYCGIESGGFIPNQWWMFGKVGGNITLVWLGPNYDNY